MLPNSFKLFVVIAAIALAGCTMSVASNQADVGNSIPGYTPSPSEQIGWFLTWNDLKPDKFVNGICADADAKQDSDYVLSVSGSGPSLVLKNVNSVTTTTTNDTPGKSGEISGDLSGKTPVGTTDVTPGAMKEIVTSEKVDTISPPVSKCSLRVIAAAVNLCVHRTATHNVVDKIESYGFDQIAGVAGTAAAIAALSHASGKTTTLVTAGSAGAVALLSSMQKSVPATTTTPEAGIVTAGLDYLQLIDDGKQMDSSRIAFLFDAAFSACPLNS